jgi:3-oxoacyl-[acyl-carrier protein] reductase
MYDFKGQVALVTGGSRGIGRATVEALARLGATTLFTYSTAEAKAREVVETLRAEGAVVSAYKLDVRDYNAARDLIEMIEREHGKLDVLVNNAGIIRDTLLLSMEADDWADVLDTNLTGVFNCLKPAAQLMMKKRRGSIVNVSSIAGTRPGRGHCNYAASKGGIEAMTKALAVELATRKIRVNAVAPGMIETDMSKGVRDLAGEEILGRIPLKRYGTPVEIANAILFLASDLAAYVTGAILHVDGGGVQ